MAKHIIELTVEGMSCSHCENAVKKAVGSLAGVESVLVDLKGKKVTVQYDSDLVELGAIKEAIDDQGYEVK